MACDICGKTNCDLIKLHDIYRTDDISDICRDCEKIVDDQLRKIQTSHSQAQRSLLKRFMAVMKLGERKMTHTPKEENRLAFVAWFTKTNQVKEMMDWSFDVWNAALSHQAAEIERLKDELVLKQTELDLYMEGFNAGKMFAELEAIDQARKESK